MGACDVRLLCVFSEQVIASPPLHHEPRGHGEQFSWLVRPERLEYVPLAQTAGPAEAVGQ